MPDTEHQVVYRAVADFGDVVAKAAAVKAALDQIAGQQHRGAAQVQQDEAATAAAVGKTTRARKGDADAVKAHTASVEHDTAAVKKNAESQQLVGWITNKQLDALNRVERKRREHYATLRGETAALDEQTRAAKALKEITGQLNVPGTDATAPRVDLRRTRTAEEVVQRDELSARQRDLMTRVRSINEEIARAEQAAYTEQDRREVRRLAAERKALEDELKRIETVAKAERAAYRDEDKRVSDRAKIERDAYAEDETRTQRRRKYIEDIAKAERAAYRESRQRDLDRQKSIEDMAKSERAAYTEDDKRNSARRKAVEDMAKIERAAYRESDHREKVVREAAERAAKQAERELATRLKQRPVRGNLTEARREFVNSMRLGYREAEQEGKAAAGRIARMFSTTLRRAVPQPPAAGGAGGGGGGGGGGGWLYSMGDAFSGAGDKITSTLGKMGKGLLSWRGLIVLAIAALGPLVAALGSLVPALLGVANVVVSLAGTMTALPGMFAALGTAVGALVVGMAPLVSVFQAYNAHQKAVADGSRQAAQAQTEAADKLRTAQRAYNSASNGYVNAQFAERRSQAALNEARRAAIRDLQDMRNELSRSSLNEEGAILALERAQAEYRKTMADGNATQLDRREALHRVKEAEFDLRDVRLRNKRLVEDTALAEKRGVEGSLQVVDARNAAEQSTVSLQQAVDRLSDAQKDLALAQEESTAGGAQGLKTLNALEDEIGKLSPSMQVVVRHMLGMADAAKAMRARVQEGLFGPLSKETGLLDKAFTNVTPLLTKAADALGILMDKAVRLVASPEWKRDLGTIADQNATLLSTLGDALIDVATGFKNLIIAAGPFTQWLGDNVRRWSEDFKGWASGAKDEGSGFKQFLGDTESTLGRVFAIFGNLFSLAGSWYRTSRGFTDWMLKAIENGTAGWKRWGQEQEKANSPLRRYLDNVKPLLSDVWDLLSKIATTFMSIASDPRNMQEAQRILTALSDKVLPSIDRIFTKLSESGAVSKVLDAIGNLLEGVATFLENGGTLPIEAFLDGLVDIVNFASGILKNKEASSVLSGLGTALGYFAAAAVTYKLLNLFKLIDGLKWLVANRSNLGGVLKDLASGKFRDAFGKLSGLGTRGQTRANPLYVHVTNPSGGGTDVDTPGGGDEKDSKGKGKGRGKGSKAAEDIVEGTEKEGFWKGLGRGGGKAGGILGALFVVFELIDAFRNWDETWQSYKDDAKAVGHFFSTTIPEWFTSVREFGHGWSGFWEQAKVQFSELTDNFVIGMKGIKYFLETWLPNQIESSIMDLFNSLFGDTLSGIKDYFVNMLPKFLVGENPGAPTTAAPKQSQAAHDIINPSNWNWDTVKKLFGFSASGSKVRGVYDGRDDTEPYMLTSGEWVSRRGVVQSPRGEELFKGLDAGAFTPEQLLGGLTASSRAAVAPRATIPTQRALAGVATTYDNSRTHGGVNLHGPLTINNPVRERSERSVRRALNKLAYLGGDN